MAKKQSINYGPDSALIQGEGLVARSEAAMNMAPGMAFSKSFVKSIQAGIEEKAKTDAILEAAIVDLGGVQNINKLDQDYNKEAITSFVRSQRDKYAKLAEAYHRTKDANILDKMDEIKFSFRNLNQQLDTLVSERASYLESFDKGQLVNLKKAGDDKYVMAYTNKGQFSVQANGDIGFNIDGKYNSFKDMAGKWNTKNNISESGILTEGFKARKLGESGKKFYRDDQKNVFSALFESTGPEGIMVMANTDLTGDNEYVLSNGQKAGNLSFESMWSQGILDEKFYQAIPKGTDTQWMYERKNKDILKSMMSEYYTDVTEYMYNEGKKNYVAPIVSDKRRQTIGVSYGQGYISRTAADYFFNDMKNKKENIISPDGSRYKLINNVYHVTNSVTAEGEPLPPQPVSNEDILMSAGMWNEGYRIDDFDMDKASDEDANTVLSTALEKSKNNSKKYTPFMQSLRDEARIQQDETTQ